MDNERLLQLEREEAEQQQLKQPVLRSIHNRDLSYVRFVNTTNRRVGIYWIDYEGKMVCYKVLRYRGNYFDCNTFVTHPWIFVDEETKERYLGNGQYVYLPKPWFAKYLGRPRTELPQRPDRTLVLITLPLYSLRDLCLRTIKRMLRYDWQAFNLEIPANLRRDLYYAPPRKHDPTENHEVQR